MITALTCISVFIASFITVRLLVNYQEEGIWSLKNPNHNVKNKS